MKYLLSMFLILLMCSCQTASIHVEYNPQVSFVKLTSYQWLNKQSAQVYKSLQQQRLKSVIEDEFSAKGMTLVDVKPDLLVDLIQRKSQKLLVESHYRPFGHYWNYWGGVDYHTSVITENELLLVFINAETNNAIWEGSITDWRFEKKSD